MKKLMLTAGTPLPVYTTLHPFPRLSVTCIVHSKNKMVV